MIFSIFIIFFSSGKWGFSGFVKGEVKQLSIFEKMVVSGSDYVDTSKITSLLFTKN